MIHHHSKLDESPSEFIYISVGCPNLTINSLIEMKWSRLANYVHMLEISSCVIFPFLHVFAKINFVILNQTLTFLKKIRDITLFALNIPCWVSHISVYLYLIDKHNFREICYGFITSHSWFDQTNVCLCVPGRYFILF